MSGEGRAAVVIASEDPGKPDVEALISTHLALMRSASPPESMHALDASGLRSADISFYGLREHGVICAVGALRALDQAWGELKSMHTAEAARGRGFGALMLRHLIAEARRRGYATLFLETDASDALAAAHRLYARFDFVECGPYGSYTADPHSMFMRLDLGTANTC